MDKAPSSSSAERFVFSLGIDVGKAALELALHDGKEAPIKTTVPNDAEGHETLLDWLQD